LSIALDATYSAGRDLSGVGVYSRNILFGLARRHPEQRFVFCYRSHRLLRAFLDRLPVNAGRALLRDGGIAPWRCRLFHALNQRLDARFAPAVATFHDLFVLTGEYSSPEFRARFARQARDAAARADLVIAVSEFTAAAVRDLLGVAADRIRVIRHGVCRHTTTAAGEEGRENLILHVGAIQERKNIARLVEAFERAAPPGWRLALAGSTHGYGAAKILEKIERSPRRVDIDVLGYVRESALEDLYRRARVFAFPSLDEGFGMPVLDAMARGVPVLTSNRSALPEVVGEAARLVDPGNSEALAGGLRELVEDSNLRDRLRSRGWKRAENFTWDRAVDQTWSVYRELAGSSGD